MTWENYKVALSWGSKEKWCCFWLGWRHEVSRKKFTHMDMEHPRRKYVKAHVRGSVFGTQKKESDEGNCDKKSEFREDI